MTSADFGRLDLLLAGVEESSHMGAVDFRVGGRIFATLAGVDPGFGNLMQDPEQQALIVGESPDLFLPVKGGWGRIGATHIRLAGALRAAYNGRSQRKVATKKAPRRESL